MAEPELPDWDLQVSTSLMGAGRVLDKATEDFLAGRLSSDEAESARVLASAWQDLAAQWQVRQDRELALELAEAEAAEAEV